MKKGERGSISIYLLLVALVLALLAQLGLLLSRHELDKVQRRLLGQQLRHLNNSYFVSLKDSDLAVGSHALFTGELEPGHAGVNVNAKVERSTDGLIRFLEVKSTAAAQGSAVQRLCQLTLDFAEPQRLLAGQYALASKTATGLEYLPSESVYKQASTEEVKLPVVRFFYNKAASDITAETALNEGLSRHFTYLDLDKTFTFKGNGRYLGDTVFINKSGIDIGAGSSFPDRLVMYSQKGNITIGNNVRMDKAFIHAYATVTIGSGCRIKGLILANKIIFKGASEFSADADVVAPFTSCAFTN